MNIRCIVDLYRDSGVLQTFDIRTGNDRFLVLLIHFIWPTSIPVAICPLITPVRRSFHQNINLVAVPNLKALVTSRSSRYVTRVPRRVPWCLADLFDPVAVWLQNSIHVHFVLYFGSFIGLFNFFEIIGSWNGLYGKVCTLHLILSFYFCSFTLLIFLNS